MTDEQDIIIAGGGLAGLATAYYLKKHVPHLRVKLLEQRPAYHQDRHWSFWLDTQSDFDFPSIIHRLYSAWSVGLNNELICRSDRFSYAVIRSADWYESVASVVGDCVEFGVTCEQVNQDCVHSNKGIYHAPMVINALPPAHIKAPLYQQFYGFTVEAEKPAFDRNCATLMDFSNAQPQVDNSACGFLYLLPLSEYRALIEPTLFTQTTFSQQWFDEALAGYMEKSRIDNWRIIETEQGLLPLAVATASVDTGFPIGMRAGWMRPSTGYAFLNSLRLAEKLAKEIATKGVLPAAPLQPYSHSASWMDKVFLRVMQQSSHLLPEIFSHWFKCIPADEMVHFLQDDEGLSIKAKIALNASHKGAFMRHLWMR